MKWWTLLLLALLLLAPDARAQDKTIRVVTLHAPPYAFEKDGRITGFATELVREGLQRIGYQPLFKIVPWKRALHMVETGDMDAVFNVVRTEERERLFHFSDEVLILEETLGFRLTGSTTTLTPDMAGAASIRLGLGSGFAYGEALDSAIQDNTFAKIEYAPTVERNVEKLLAGRISLFLADGLPTFQSLRTLGIDSEVELLTDAHGQPVVFGTSRSHLAFSRKTMTESIARRFSDALRGMKRDGTYDRIKQQYH